MTIRLGFFGIAIILFLLLVFAGAALSAQISIKQMIGDSRYWPPACHSEVCVLTGYGGIVDVWTRHVDTQLALGRHFVVKGICASACEIAARRAHARVSPGAQLIVHHPQKPIWH